jgi:hypothetical protein
MLPSLRLRILKAMAVDPVNQLKPQEFALLGVRPLLLR